MTLDALCSEMPEIFCAPDDEATEKAAYGDPSAAMPSCTSSALCETALKVLSRDSQLRRAYLQRRWQGLVAPKPSKLRTGI